METRSFTTRGKCNSAQTEQELTTAAAFLTQEKSQSATGLLQARRHSRSIADWDWGTLFAN